MDGNIDTVIDRAEGRYLFLASNEMGSGKASDLRGLATVENWQPSRCANCHGCHNAGCPRYRPEAQSADTHIYQDNAVMR